MSRVVVVGAGVGGLAVAARLSRLGHQVTVCEQAPAVGGKLGCYQREGWRFDTGPSLLTLPAVFRDLFRTTGRPIEDVLDLVPVAPLAHYRFADGTRLDVPNTGLTGICGALEDGLGAGAGADWGRLMDRAAEIWSLTRTTVLEAPVAGVGTLARLVRRPGDVTTVAPWRTLRGLGRGSLRDPRLRMLLDRYATYTGSDPRRAPAALVTVPYVEQVFGGWYVRGGLYRLAEALADRARQRGAVVRLRAEVGAVDLDAGRVCGVTLAGGERLPADVVVSDADATRLYADLVPGPAAKAALRRVRRATPSLSGFVLLLGVRAAAGGAPAGPGAARQAPHTVLFPADYDAEFDAIFGRRPEPVRDPTIYLAVPDDPSVAPPGGQAWFVLVNAPRHDPAGGVDWDAPGLAAGYADRLLDLLADRGFDVRDRLAFAEWRTPADLERATGAVGGSIYGSSSNGVRAAFLRPANASPVPGLFLVGGSAHPGGGLPLVGLSAATVARLVGRA